MAATGFISAGKPLFMSEKGRTSAVKWDFDKVTECFNCGKEAIQRIDLRPDEIVVTCLNCGAARHYRLSGVYIAETFGEDAARS